MVSFVAVPWCSVSFNMSGSPTYVCSFTSAPVDINSISSSFYLNPEYSVLFDFLDHDLFFICICFLCIYMHMFSVLHIV